MLLWWKKNHVLSSPGTNKYLRSSLFQKKAVTSMVKLFPRRPLYEIFYKTHKIMSMFTHVYNHIKILTNRLAAQSKACTISHCSTQWRCEFIFPQRMHICMSATFPCFCCNRYLPRRLWNPKKWRPWKEKTCAIEIGSYTIRNRRHLSCRYSALWAHAFLAKCIKIFNM
jgi:hypothetical protein